MVDITMCLSETCANLDCIRKKAQISERQSWYDYSNECEEYVEYEEEKE